MFGIYLHIPFCVSKCHYCDFYSEEIIPVRTKSSGTNLIKNPNNIREFTNHLLNEIELHTANSDMSKSVSSIFFGGGTPSLLTSQNIDDILNQLSKKFHFDNDIEITLECNPGTTSLEKLKNYRTSGANRLSFGAQSFIEQELNFLQRIHSPEQIQKSIEWARIAGFDNVSLDLMFSLPGQTDESWLYTLNQAIELKPQHISAYSLIYEPETPLYDDLMIGKVIKLPEDEDAALYELTKQVLIEEGYLQYEVSNFALKENYFCRHNLNYWSGGDYVAFGPSAHGYLDGKRYWNYRDNVKYYNLLRNNILPVEDSETISENQKLTELIFLGLRSTGVNVSSIYAGFGYDIIGRNNSLIKDLTKDNLILLKDDVLYLSTKGYSICDEIALKFIEKI
jgi:oxygen-independent coproporphyrinogen-3 oxidase